MKSRFYNDNRVYYIRLTLRGGQLTPEVIVALGSAAVGDVTGLSARSPLIR